MFVTKHTHVLSKVSVLLCVDNQNCDQAVYGSQDEDVPHFVLYNETMVHCNMF